MFTLLLLCAVCLAGSYFYLQNRRYKGLEVANGCQPPKRYPYWDPVLGIDFFFETGKMLGENRYFPVTQERFAKYGNTFQTKLPGTPIITSCEPENIQNVFATNAGNWGVSWRQTGFDEYCGRGFLTADGAEWRASRAMLDPSFNKANIWDHETYERYLSLMIKRIPRDGTTVDLQELINMLYLDTATLFLFGESFGSLASETSGEARLFLESAETSLQIGGFRNALGPLRFLHYNSKFYESNRIVADILSRYVDRAFERKDAAGGEKLQSEKKHTLMLDGMVLQSNDRAAIRNSVLQGFIAAHETTGHLISNIFWLLARYPKVWAELRTEVLKSIGNQTTLTFDHAQKIPYIKDVINETLRLYPVFPMHQRVAFKDTTLPTGGGPHGTSPIFVPAGTRFEANYVALHRRKDFFGSDADSFRPERWSELDLKSWQFVPFSGGPRVCVGRQKALAETGYFICRMVREFERIELRDDREWAGAVTVTARNANGCLVGLVPS